MLVILLQIVFVFACFLLIVAVLLQQGKGGGVSGAFGIGGASQTIFGASGAGDFLTKATWVLGGAFMFLSLILAVLSGSMHSTARRSVLEPTGTSAPATAPASEAPGLPGATTPGAATPTSGAPAGTAPAPSGTAPAATNPAPANPPGAGTSTATGH